ncbi:hypothetical protein V3589_02620 [Sinorhizobium fredii]|uniref:hypothetical protein n=1 Tax=Rhizobium fredii TaxID=380 RepID=UPI0030999B62
MGWWLIPATVTFASLGVAMKVARWPLGRSLMSLFELIVLLMLSNLCLVAWLIWALAH